jgi:hypothetical protein
LVIVSVEDSTPNVQRPTPKEFASRHPTGGVNTNPQKSKSGRIGMIDLIAQDPKTGEIVLVMNEPNELDDSDEQLLSLQERFNAYVSFLLDGEMTEAHPELAGKPSRIELRCAHMPDARALELLGLIHDQLAFQEIRLEVVVKDTAG